LVALLCSPQVNDVLATLVNAHWWLGVGLLVLGMLKDPMSRLAQAGEIAFALVAALSGFAALYALPILSVRAIRERSRQSLAVLSVVVAGLLAQTPSLLASGRRGDIMAIASDFTMALEIFVRRVVGSALFGPANVWDLAALNWLIVILIGLLSVALAKLWYDLLKQQAVRLEAVALLTTVIAGWFFAMWAVTQPGGALEMLLWPGAANRYFLISNAAIYLTLLLRLSLLRVEPTVSTLSKAALGVASLLLAIGIASGYRLSPIGSPDWASFAECVDEGRPRCVTVIPPAWTLEVHPPQ
jgi:hypothetical protein